MRSKGVNNLLHEFGESMVNNRRVLHGLMEYTGCRRVILKYVWLSGLVGGGKRSAELSFEV